MPVAMDIDGYNACWEKPVENDGAVVRLDAQN
jgi:hypothetical protein